MPNDGVLTLEIQLHLMSWGFHWTLKLPLCDAFNGKPLISTSFLVAEEEYLKTAPQFRLMAG